MCQIMFKPAGYVLRDDLLASTCTVNGDGFGFMLVDPTHGLIADKVYNGKNDPATVKEVMETLKDKDVFFHFRFRTKGAVDTDSCHPFVIFDDFDRQVCLMHNGTLHGFGSDTVVDSFDFGLRIAGPLYGEFLKAGNRNPLKNELYQTIISHYVGSSSKIVLMDNTGDAIIINEKGGTDYKDDESNVTFWVSNTYSFDEDHRKPASTVKPYYDNTYYSKTWRERQEGKTVPWVPDADMYEQGTDGIYRKKGSSVIPFPKSDTKDVQVSAMEAVSTIQNIPDTPSGGIRPQSSQELTVTTVTETAQKEPSYGDDIEGATGRAVADFPERIPRQSYVYDILKLNDIDALFDLEFTDIEQLVEGEPKNAALLINDLLGALFELQYEDQYDTVE